MRFGARESVIGRIERHDSQPVKKRKSPFEFPSDLKFVYAFSMKRSFLALALLLPACHQQDNVELAALKAKVADLEKQLQLAKPGFGEFMGTVQQHHEKLYFAGIAENWELSGYELNEIRETVDQATALWPRLGDEKVDLGTLKHLIDPPIEEITKAIAQKDKKKFLTSFENLTRSCNACHQASGHAFVVIQTPQTASFGNQKFAK
jgi:hypothetical protein